MQYILINIFYFNTIFFSSYKIFKFQVLVPQNFSTIVPIFKSNHVYTSHFLMKFYRDVYNIIKITSTKFLNFSTRYEFLSAKNLKIHI